MPKQAGTLLSQTANKVGTQMITANKSASSRTKNRIREHNLELISGQEQVGSDFVHVSKVRWESLNAVWFKFECSDVHCEWVGWLPSNEIDITV